MKVVSAGGHGFTSRSRELASSAVAIGGDPDTVELADHTEEGPKKSSVVVAAALGASSLATLALAALYISRAPGVAAKVAATAMLGGGMIAGWATADVASGVAHHALDNYFTKDTPLIGGVAESFQGHHDSPSLEEGSLLDNIAEPAMVGIALNLATIAGLALGGGSLPVLATAGLAGLGLTFGLGGAFTQASHRWSHMEEPPKLAQIAQKLNLSMTRDQHDAHHSGSYDKDYAIVTGWSNNLLNSALRKWEVIIEKTTGVRPGSWDNPDVERLAKGEITKDEFEVLRSEKMESGELVSYGGHLEQFPAMMEVRNQRRQEWDARRAAKKGL